MLMFYGDATFAANYSLSLNVLKFLPWMFYEVKHYTKPHYIKSHKAIFEKFSIFSFCFSAVFSVC